MTAVSLHFAEALGVRAACPPVCGRPRVAFGLRRSFESDARTYRTPKHFVRNHTIVHKHLT
jgi:hypothetical protein